MSRRFLIFSSLSLAGMLLVSLMLIEVFSYINTRTLEKHFHDHNLLIARILRNGLINVRLPHMLQEGGNRQANTTHFKAFEAELREYLVGIPVVKVKLFDQGGLTIYSSAPGEAGKDASNNPGVYAALKGLTTGNMVFRDRFNSFDGVIENRNLYQVYIPIYTQTNQTPHGAFEIYSDVTPFMKQISDTEQDFLTGLIAVLGSFLLLQVWLYYRTDKALVNEQGQTQRYLHELEENRQALESRVQVRTEELETSRYFLQSVIDGIANPLFVITKELRVSLMNKAAKGLIQRGTSLEQMSHCYQISHRRNTPCSGEDHPCSFQEVMRTQETSTVRHNHYDADDNPIIVDVISTPLYGKSGEMQGIIEVQHDVTELVSAKRNLAQSEARLQAILDQVPDAIFTLDAGAHIDSANQAAVRMFGSGQHGVLGRTFESLFSGEGNILPTHHDEGVREFYALKQDGQRFPVDLWVGNLQFGPDKRHVAVVRDITERKIAAEELERTRQQYFHQEKMAAIGQLAAGILHEVGNPIAAIAGAAHDMRTASKTDLLKEDTSLPEVVGRNLIMIEEHTERLAKITRDIADFASPRTRERELTDLNGLIRSTTRLLGYDKRFRHMEIRQELDPQLPAIEVVPDQITQVLMNLIINSLDASANSAQKTPLVEVISRLAGRGIEIEVKDNGVGMDEKTLEHASEPFFTTKEPGKGTGLGLSLCSSIIDSHQGRLRINSVPGEGTSVTIFLPEAEMFREMA